MKLFGSPYVNLTPRRRAMAPDDPGLIQRLLDKKVRMLVARGDEDAPSWLSILVSWLPFFAIAGFS